MAWTTPKDWTTDELVTASDLNTHLRDNLNALKSPPSAHFEANESSDYTTTSTSFVDVDATAGKLSLTITTNGGDVLVHFHGSVENGGGSAIFFDVAVDGTRTAGDDGILRARASTTTDTVPVSFTRLITGLSAGAHTFKLQWKVGANTATLCAGAGTSGKDVHPQFWAREVS
jgi:hypothetical protein